MPPIEASLLPGTRSRIMTCRFLHCSDLALTDPYSARPGRLAGFIETVRADTTPVVVTGDNADLDVLSLVQDGRQAHDIVSQITPDFDIFAPHDFANGVMSILSIVQDSPKPWLSSNLYSGLRRIRPTAGVVPAAIRTIKGAGIGVVGPRNHITPEFTPGPADLRVTDPDKAIQRVSSALRVAGGDPIGNRSHGARKQSRLNWITASVTGLNLGPGQLTLGTVGGAAIDPVHSDTGATRDVVPHPPNEYAVLTGEHRQRVTDKSQPDSFVESARHRDGDRGEPGGRRSK